jgi:hypothetical protein
VYGNRGNPSNSLNIRDSQGIAAPPIRAARNDGESTSGGTGEAKLAGGFSPF